MKQSIVHVSESAIIEESGMGRVEYYWKKAFENRGYNFIHIGPAEVGKLFHKAMFGWKARLYFKALNIKPEAFIVHEPASGYFVNKDIPVFVESHGVERKHWELQFKKGSVYGYNKPSLKTRLFFPLWRLKMGDKGLKNADKLLLINSEDKEYVKHTYKRKEQDMYVFRNGVNMNVFKQSIQPELFTILFNGSWIDRKGIKTLVEAAKILFNKNKLHLKYLLIGTGKNEETILQDWPAYLRPQVIIIPTFTKAEEQEYLVQSSILVLPSYFEGQPLSLLQAMNAGKCCITTNCCGQKDIINNGKNGLLFEAGNASALAALIYKCFSNPAMASMIGKEARATCENRSWKIVSDELADFIISCLNKHHF